MSTSPASAVVGTVIGGLLVLMGLARMASAPSAGGLAAGLLMTLSGLILAPHGRLAVESMFGGRMSKHDAASMFMLALLGSFALNLLAP